MRVEPVGLAKVLELPVATGAGDLLAQLRVLEHAVAAVFVRVLELLDDECAVPADVMLPLGGEGAHGAYTALQASAERLKNLSHSTRSSCVAYMRRFLHASRRLTRRS